jgi:hypothetical protein
VTGSTRGEPGPWRPSFERSLRGESRAAGEGAGGGPADGQSVRRGPGEVEASADVV